MCEKNFEAKRLSYVFSRTYCTVGVLSVEALTKLKSAYGEWFVKFEAANKIALGL